MSGYFFVRIYNKIRIMVLTIDQLKHCMPYGKETVLEANLAAINHAFDVYQINTPLRASHFLAQIAHESGCLNFTEENLNYGAQLLVKVFPHFFPNMIVAMPYDHKPQAIANVIYANRMGNGDAASNDGWNFRGRGAIQITGKLNYSALCQVLGVDLIKNPDLLEQPQYSMLAAGNYWKTRGLNELADHDDILTITKKINGGTNGLDERKHYLEIAKQFLLH
jgi:putative chitinase